MKRDALVRDLVRRANAGRAGVVVVVLPGDQPVVGADCAPHVDHAGRPEVRPGQLLLARPHELDWRSRGARQPCGLDRRLAGVLAAVRRSGVGHDHANALARQVKRIGELALHAERALRAGPDREVVALPFRHGRARLERAVRDVSHGVAGLERREPRRQAPLRHRRSRSRRCRQRAAPTSSSRRRASARTRPTRRSTRP